MDNMSLINYLATRTPIHTDFEHVNHLIRSSSWVKKNGKYATPNQYELVLGECIGGRTIFVGNDRWEFAVDKNVLMESPDILFGKYPRDEYKFDLFIGDEHGCIVARASGRLTHALLIRKLKDEGHAEMSAIGFRLKSVPANFRKVGNPEYLDTIHAGSILFKQPGEVDVPETLVSFWYGQGYKDLRHHVKSYCVQQHEGPYRAEIPDEGDETDSLNAVKFVEVDF